MSLQPLAPYLSIAEIILAVVLIVLVLLQSKGSDLGGFMGGGGGETIDLPGGDRFTATVPASVATAGRFLRGRG